MPAHSRCRICATPLPEPFLDLGEMPLANAFLSSAEEFPLEKSYPLAVSACPQCSLVQLNFVVPPEILYRHYLYVSSTSEAVGRYAATLASEVGARRRLGKKDLVVELGSNDGLVLQAFQRQGARVLGVEPARNIAAVARERGIPTAEEFFTEAAARRLAAEEGKASVILGRHVFAHIDNLHDFFRAVAHWLAPEGTLLIEVPYLGNLLAQLEFDTIYHEHLSYLSLRPVMELCARHGFELTDTSPVPLHGGSLLFSIHRTGTAKTTERLNRMWKAEAENGLHRMETFAGFAQRVARWKEAFEGLIASLGSAGARFVGYGAAAKANTLLNFCPSVAQQLTAILDRNPLKQGSYTPGTHVPVVSAEAWRKDGATHMLILAWNFKEEILAQMRPFAERGGRFLVPIPRPELI
ncbi:MAG: class I SAM-dependent methyltransferase [Candidatus Omnitrophica bacterium]|nr:class I SAM-dependent methyltransferase [Candidatus Omnitrophota bacterium]